VFCGCLCLCWCTMQAELSELRSLVESLTRKNRHLAEELSEVNRAQDTAHTQLLGLQVRSGNLFRVVWTRSDAGRSSLCNCLACRCAVALVKGCWDTLRAQGAAHCAIAGAAGAQEQLA
jgi:hypothetical protein